MVRVTNPRESDEVTEPTARRDLEELEKAGIVARLDDISRITYFSPAILQVICGDRAP